MRPEREIPVRVRPAAARLWLIGDQVLLAEVRVWRVEAWVRSAEVRVRRIEARMLLAVIRVRPAVARLRSAGAPVLRIEVPLRSAEARGAPGAGRDRGTGSPGHGPAVGDLHPCRPDRPALAGVSGRRTSARYCSWPRWPPSSRWGPWSQPCC